MQLCHFSSWNVAPKVLDVWNLKENFEQHYLFIAWYQALSQWSSQMIKMPRMDEPSIWSQDTFEGSGTCKFPGRRWNEARAFCKKLFHFTHFRKEESYLDHLTLLFCQLTDPTMSAVVIFFKNILWALDYSWPHSPECFQISMSWINCHIMTPI
jgi:hypothetical protein